LRGISEHDAALQDRKIAELHDDVAAEKSGKEALTQALVAQVSQKQQHADEAKKQSLLSADAIHASTPSLGLQPRPPSISKAENLRGKNQREHVARELTPKEGSRISAPRKVGAPQR